MTRPQAGRFAVLLGRGYVSLPRRFVLTRLTWCPGLLPKASVATKLQRMGDAGVTNARIRQCG
jgi:hypothetical protein